MPQNRSLSLFFLWATLSVPGQCGTYIKRKGGKQHIGQNVQSLSLHQDACKDYHNGSTTVIPNFLAPGLLLDRLKDEEAWFGCNERGSQWMHWGATPKNIFEEVAVRVFQNHPVVVTELQGIDTGRTKPFGGYKYWCNILHPGDGRHPWHVDLDEVSFAPERHGVEGEWKVVNPAMGSVFWGYPHNTKGGYLELLPNHDFFDISTWQEAVAQAKDPSSLEQYPPLYNHLVTFNGSKWHGVSALEEGQRYVLAVNFWKTMPLKGNFMREYEEALSVLNDQEMHDE